jgi:hypothetical protein
MRFAVAHKLTSYLTVACAFAALASSSELSSVPCLLAFLGIAASWFWEPPRIQLERYERVWAGLSAAALAYSIFLFVNGTDVLVTGAQFLLYLVVAKLFNRRACKDYLHVYILSFLMLVAGTVLNAEVTFGLFFLGFVVTSTWSLVLFHLRREMEENFLLRRDGHAEHNAQVERIMNSRRIVGRRFFAATSMVSLIVFVCSSLLFLLIPRIGFGLVFAPGRSEVAMAGFSDGVQLGGHGLIKDDDTVVMRVKFQSDVSERDTAEIHWRGVAFDHYSHGEWTRSQRAPSTRRVVNVEDGTSRQYVLYDRAVPTHPKALVQGALRQEVYLEPNGYDVLFGASMPVAYEFPLSWREYAHKERNDEIRHPHQSGIKYVVYSNPLPPSPAQLRAAGDKLPPGYDVYLQLPDDIPSSVRTLAAEITRGATNDYDRAVAIERWLQTNMSYTLQLEPPGKHEPIAFFLFERKRGHCEYFSSAMAVLARSAGVPTRNVNGFLGGEWNEYDEYIAVRAGDAHSWVEVYFPGSGWVTFDPTPAGAASSLGRGQLSLFDHLRRYADTLRFKWFRWVIEYDLYRQISMFREMGSWMQGGNASFREGARSMREFARENRDAMSAVVAALLVLAIAGAVWRRRRRGVPLAGVSRRSTARRGPIASLYRGALTRLAKRGFPRAPSTTPREYAAALSRLNAPGAAPLRELTELYYTAEYGHLVDDQILDRARSLRTTIDEQLRAERRGYRKIRWGVKRRVPGGWEKPKR